MTTCFICSNPRLPNRILCAEHQTAALRSPIGSRYSCPPAPVAEPSPKVDGAHCRADGCYGPASMKSDRGLCAYHERARWHGATASVTTPDTTYAAGALASALRQGLRPHHIGGPALARALREGLGH